MALTGAYTLTKYMPDLDIQNVPYLHVWDIEAGLGTDCTEDVPLLYLPENTIIHALTNECLITDTGATNTGSTPMLETLNVALIVVDDTNMDTSRTRDTSPFISGATTTDWFPLAAEDELRVLITTTGGATDPGAIMRVSALISRIDR